jgi:cell division protein ZapA (FtsZ GTPase activity inhibitor)
MPEPLLKEIVPQEYHDAGYLKDLLDKDQKTALPEVFKKLHNAQGLIGKKSGLPTADAPEEEWSKFLGSLKAGKPEEYQVPKGADGKDVDPAFAKALQASFHEGDVHPKQAAKFMAKFQAEMKGYAEQQSKAKKDAEEKAAKAFDEIARVALGEQNKEKMTQAKKLLEEHCPANLKAYVGKLDDNALVIMAGVINAIAAEYMPEDALNPKGKTGGDSGLAKRQEAMKLQQEIVKMTGFEPDYDDKVKRMKSLYAEAAADGQK